MRRRLVCSLAAAVAAGLAGCGGAEEVPPRSPGGGEGRTTATAAPERAPWPHLEAIARVAGRHGGHRASGSPGGVASEELIARRLREAGWRVRFEAVRFPEFREERAPRVRAGGRAVRGVATLRFSGSGRASGRVAEAAGLGCAATDWRRVPRGAVALVRRGTCAFTRKAELAQAVGAAAVLVVDRRTFPGSLRAPGALRVPVLAASDAAAARLRAAGRATVDVRTVSRRGRARNVVAELAGRDPALPPVVAGAHLDSVAEGPGVNDDGSGVAALLAIAGRLRSAGQDRTVRLGFWAAEELGLHGSRAHVRAMGRPRPAAYLNLDMVASPNPVLETYGGGAPERALRDALPGEEGRASLGGASDHASFARAGVPVAGVFTGASERGPGGRRRDPCYHRACDDLGNADRPTLERVTDGVERALRALAAR